MWLRQEVQALPRCTEAVTLTLTAPDSGIRTSTDGQLGERFAVVTARIQSNHAFADFCGAQIFQSPRIRIGMQWLYDLSKNGMSLEYSQTLIAGENMLTRVLKDKGAFDWANGKIFQEALRSVGRNYCGGI